MKNIYWERFKIAFLKPLLESLLLILGFIWVLLQVALFPIFGIVVIVGLIVACVVDVFDRLLISPTYFVVTGIKSHSDYKNVYKRPLDFFSDCVENFLKWSQKHDFTIYGDFL